MSFWSLDNNLDETEAKAGNATDRTMEGGALANTRSNEQVALADAQSAKYAPYSDSGLESQKRLTASTEDRSNKVWDTYTQSYVPVADKVASDAMNFDSPDQLERAAQQAGADVTKSFGSQRDIQQRNLERMGINPGSAAFVRGTSNLGLEEAAARAGAETGARDSRRLQAVGLRSNAMQQGQQLATNANTSSQLALAGAQGLVTSADKATMSPLTARGTAVPWMNASTTSYNDAGTLANNKWATNVNADVNLMGQMSDVVGGLAGSFSSKEVKEDKKPLDGDRVLEGLEKIPVEQWTYKKGVADEGKHVGPYAEDVNAQFGDKVAPGGKMLDTISMIGLTLAAVKALAKKVDGKDKISRPTEPRARQNQSDDYERAGSGGNVNGYDRGRGSSGVMEKTFGLQPIEVSAEGAY